MEDLIGVRVSDPAEEPRVGDRPLERVILASQTRCEIRYVRVQHLEAPAVELRERVRALHDVNRRAPLRARLREIERPSLEPERSLSELAADRLSSLTPSQTPGDHEMNDDVQRVVRADDDPLAESADGSHLLADHGGERRVDRSEHERVEGASAADLLTEDPRSQRFDVDGDVRELGQPSLSSLDGGWASRIDRRCLAARVEPEPGKLPLRREHQANHERLAAAAELRGPPVLRFPKAPHEPLLDDFLLHPNVPGHLNERGHELSGRAALLRVSRLVSPKAVDLSRIEPDRILARD